MPDGLAEDIDDVSYRPAPIRAPLDLYTLPNKTPGESAQDIDNINSFSENKDL